MEYWPASLQDTDALMAFCVLFPGASRFDLSGIDEAGGVGFAILQEDGDLILQEQGGDILQEG